MTPTKQLGQAEFVALMAMLSATIAFSIDAMLPALPEIGQDLTPDALNRAQLIITSFVLGMGVGTFFTGPLSDAFGRRRVIVGGVIVYIAATLVAWQSQTLNGLLIARVVMGLGAAGPRVATMAMVRDIYGGRDMARIMSFMMMVFSLIPAFAPTIGAFVIAGFGWRAIFIVFIIFVSIISLWLITRQPETLPPEKRQPLNLKAIGRATREVLQNRTTRLSIMVQTLSLGMLFSILSSTQQVFDQTFGKGDTFHYWFGGIAIVAASASIINAKFVVKLGMRAMIKGMFTAQIIVSGAVIAINLGTPSVQLAFWAFVIWNVTGFFQAGLTIGNLIALAMEPMGHIAGTAASVISALATVGAIIIAIPIGLAFDGTPLPVVIGVFVCAIVALWLTNKIRRPGEED